MRKTLAFLLALCLLFTAVSAAAEPAEYTEKTVRVFTGGVESGETALRFYAETPNVPYMGFIQCAALMNKYPLVLEQGEGGLVILRNEAGGELLCDVGAGTITAKDWTKVVNPPLPMENAAIGMKDTNCRFVRITDIAYEGEPAPVVFDFAKYGMRIYADGRDVYLPLAVLSNMLTDIATTHLRWSGDCLYCQRIEMVTGQDTGPVVPEIVETELKEGERPADIAKQCYAELCFNFDYFFGHPGKALLDAAIGEKGLDAALADAGEEGSSLRANLTSTSLSEYLPALLRLFAVDLADGHTSLTDLLRWLNSDAFKANPELTTLVATEFTNSLTQGGVTRTQVLNLATSPQRSLAWGSENYLEFGSTAVIRLDTFMPDEAAWEQWYQGTGGFPEDCVGIVVSGLRKASENPEIKNVIFDLSCNGGGSSDVLMVILGMTTGQDKLYGRNRLTGQTMTLTFEADTNFDGFFDEKDKEARFDFNYGVLTTRQAFSCGNLFPILFREGGAVVIGEPTSGGSCCIQIGTDSENNRYGMSSCQWQIIDSTGQSVEGGCTVDLPIEPVSIGLVDKIAGFIGVDEGVPIFAPFFDGENLDRMMNEWFREAPEAVPAA